MCLSTSFTIFSISFSGQEAPSLDHSSEAVIFFLFLFTHTIIFLISIKVRKSQLRESAEVSVGQNSLAGYELYDLVVLSGGGSANEVGIIVRVGLEDFTVVNNHGINRDVRPEELRGKRNTMSNRAVALDVQGNQMRCGDVERRHRQPSSIA